MKLIRLIPAVALLLASAASATVFQPASDRQLVDRSDAVVVATVRDATTHVRADGYVATDYRFDIEETLKGTAAGTITVSEIGGASGNRFTFISDSATYSPGERVLVLLKERRDGTYFTTSMAMGKFSFTRTARGETALTRDVSELRDDPARLADVFESFVRGTSTEKYTTTLTPITTSLRPIALTTASSYCLFTNGSPGFPVRWENGETARSVDVLTNGTMPYSTTAPLASACAAWTNDPTANISLSPGGTTTASTSDGTNSIYVYLNATATSLPGICDGALGCTAGFGGSTHTFRSETFVGITGADVFVRSGVTAAQFESLITHELGHSIGFRHSDAGTPFSSQAIMATNINSSFGSSLFQWDLDANDTVYGNGPACIAPTSVSISGDSSVASGQTATLTAMVSGGNRTFTYEWFDGVQPDTSHPVGGNSPTFTTPAITATKNYWVRVHNDCGTVTATKTVQVIACTPASIVSQSSSTTITSGQTASLTVNPGGTAPFNYQWYQATSTADTSTPVGSNSPFFTTPPLTQTTSYWVKVTNDCGTAISNSVITVSIAGTCTPAVIVSQSNSQTINSGATASLTVTAGGSQPFTYQWYEATSNTDTSKPVGTNSPSFTTPALTQATSYWVKVTNPCGFANSNVVTIAIAGACAKPSFSIQPSSSILAPGSQIYLIAFASNAVSYQWFKGNAGDTSTPVAGFTPSNDRWINQFYLDLLGRPADAAGLSGYGALLTGGASRTTVATGVLVSTEYRQRLITSYFSTFLHRSPSVAELAFWLPAFTAGLSDEQIQAQFVASPEYFAIAGGTNATWINRVFNDVLGRVPSAPEVAAFSTLLGTSSRTTVGLSILNSSEAGTRRVQQYYQRFLRRAPTAAETTPLITLADEQVIALIIGSDEYFSFGTIVVTDPINTTTRYWVRATNACAPNDSNTAILTIPQCETTIATEPKDVTIVTGSPVSLSVAAFASGALTYQWYRAQTGDPSNPIPGGTGPVLTLAPSGSPGPTQYWVKVSNGCSSANSRTVTVTVNCGPRMLTMSVPPTAPSASSYTVTWNGDATLDFRYEVQEAAKADFSDAQTFTVSGTPSRSFTHTVTADTRYYYRAHAAPLCGGDYGDYSPAGSIVVTVSRASTETTYNFAQPPCTGQNCTTRQSLFIPGITSAGKTALATGDTYSASSDKAFVTISPSSGPLPSEGVTVTVTIDTTGLDVGSTQATVNVIRTHAAGKVGALGDPPAPINVPVSVSVVAPVTQTPKDPNAPLNALLIPAIAHADGIGARFVSDVRLTNTSAQSINYQLTYTPNSTDGTITGKQTLITVAGGDTKALNDIVKDWYGSGVLGEAPQGSLEIRPLNYAGKDPVSISLATVAASRTYSVTSLGTFGQFIPALQLANFLSKSDVSRISLQQVSQSNTNGGFRTNLGFVEGSGQPVDFVATLLDDSGAKLAERAYSLKPYESQQIRLDSFFNVNGVTLPNVSDARVEVKVTSDTGHVTAYASVLDNITTDPLLVFPADPSKIAASRFVVPGVAEFTSSFSNFHTDMRIYNGGSSAVDVTLTFTGASVPNKVKTIAAGATLALNDVLPTLWGITGGGSVVATTATDSQLVVTARTFSRDATTGGTFGQFIPGVTAADAVGNGDRTLQIVQLEESPAFRTNLGLVEVTGNSATVELLAYTPDSKVAARTVVPLSASQYLQQGQIFKSLGFSNVYNGRITARVTSGTGRVAAYGSVIDNRTTDPTYVPSQ